MTTSVSLPVLGTRAGSEPVEVPVEHVNRSLETHAVRLRKVGGPDGHCYSYRLPKGLFGSELLTPGETSGTLLEDNAILGPGGQYHQSIRRRGEGAYSLWVDDDRRTVTLFFSSSDNSDPRTNGRQYTVLTRPLQFEDNWPHFMYRSWLNHSRSRYFLNRGGDRTPPPLYASMGITDICNLQCSICGSQNMMTPVNRRHMDNRVFRMVADTIFPFLISVELNSRGEPMIHPNFPEMLETMLEYGIFMRLQTNGTQFQARKLHLLSKMNGHVSMSIDATKDLFEYARAGAKWAQVDEGIRNLAKLRNPDELGLGLYPTLTRKTADGAFDLMDWAMDVGIDRIDFHTYEPIECGIEHVVTDEQMDRIRSYAASRDPKHPIQIWVQYDRIKRGEDINVRQPPQLRWGNIPHRDSDSTGHPLFTCMAPVQMVEIDLDGGVSVCCRTQDRKLGNALTPEAFADCWFGAEYQAIRESLRRTNDDPILSECRDCIRYHIG